MKKTFTLTCLILASVIGAGFASGKEIQVFFTNYGIVSFFTIVLAYFLFSKLFNYYLLFGNKNKPGTFFNATNLLFGKYSKIINAFILICYFIVLAGMFAGLYEVYVNVFSVTLAKVLVIITVMVVALENSGGIKVINLINNLFIPLTMLVLIISAILKLDGVNSFNLSTSLQNGVWGILSVFSYVGINLLLSGSILITEGSKYGLKNIKSASVLSSFVLVLIIFLFNIVLLKNNVNTSMPMLTLSFQVGWWWGIVTLICIWFSIYSAITSVTYVLSHSIFKGENNFVFNLIICVVAYIISLFGFNKIIEFLYPVIGVVGLIFSVVLILKIKKVNPSKNATMQSSKNGLIK